MTKLGTWNLQNLFHPGGGSGSPGDQDTNRAKLVALARTITTLDPDVLAVQEVGDPTPYSASSLGSTEPGISSWPTPTGGASAWESCRVGR
jgi:hypothetical protein